MSIAAQRLDLQEARDKMLAIAELPRVKERMEAAGAEFEETNDIKLLERLKFQWDPDSKVTGMKSFMEETDAAQLREVYDSIKYGPNEFKQEFI